MNKLSLLFLFICMNLFSQNPDGGYNPYLNNSSIEPAPVIPIELNGEGTFSFNFGNTGGDTLYVYPEHYIILTITLSYVEPKLDPVLSIYGPASEFFYWTYNVNTKTYKGKQINDIPEYYSDKIFIDFKTVQNSLFPGMNGFNVNITPAPYQILSNSQPDDALSQYTYTEELISFSKPLWKGWNWFSINVRHTDMSINNIIPGKPGYYIKNQTESATYYEDIGWFGTLDTINPRSSFFIKTTEIDTIKITGISLPDTTKIYLKSGWNWFSFLPSEAMDAQEVVSTLPSYDRDYIKDQISSICFYEGYGWFGLMKQMLPGNGYLGRFHDEFILEYPSSVKKNIYSPTFKSNNFQYNSSITFYIDNANEGDEIQAYCKDEYRGNATPIYFPLTGKYVFPLMIYSNEDGSEINFKYYKNGELIDCNNTITFKNNEIIGDAENPILLSPVGIINTQDNFRIYPSPFTDFILVEKENIIVKIYDISGKLMLEETTISNNHKINTEDIPSGTYILKTENIRKRIIKI